MNPRFDLQVGGARNGTYSGRHQRSVGNGGMVMSTAPAATGNVYYHYVPMPNPPLYYPQSQQYPTAPVSTITGKTVTRTPEMRSYFWHCPAVPLSYLNYLLVGSSLIRAPLPVVTVVTIERDCCRCQG